MRLSGVRISKGLGIGSALFIKKDFNSMLSESKIPISEIEGEIKKFHQAKDNAINVLNNLIRKTIADLGKDKEGIFEGQVLIIEDEELDASVRDFIENKHYNAPYAVHKAFEEMIEIIESHKDVYLRERATDFKDVRNRLVSMLLGAITDFSGVDRDVILITDELAPSDTMQVDLSYVKGFLTTSGGETSHAAILARTMALPAIVIPTSDLSKIKNEDLIIVDGINSLVILNPTENELSTYRAKFKKVKANESELFSLKDQPTLTKDGVRVVLKSNIGTLSDIEYVNKYGGEGVGLFRTEFLYMETQQPPSEDEQFNVYKSVLESLEKKNSVIIRTLDIGGDKKVPYLRLPREENPFLGYRALRIYKDYEKLMQTQFNAIFRASHYGAVKIMIPMLTKYEELELVEYFVEEAKKSLRARNLPFDDNLELGCMIEVPSSALLVKQLAKKLKFFSIGTNDLTQYVLAVDRGNQKIADLYDKYNPSVLKVIKYVLDQANEVGVTVSVCGELGGDEGGALILVGLGCRSLSMVPNVSLRIKYLLKKYTIKELNDLALRVLNSETELETLKYIEEMIGDRYGII